MTKQEIIESINEYTNTLNAIVQEINNLNVAKERTIGKIELLQEQLSRLPSENLEPAPTKPPARKKR